MNSTSILSKALPSLRASQSSAGRPAIPCGAYSLALSSTDYASNQYSSSTTVHNNFNRPQTQDTVMTRSPVTGIASHSILKLNGTHNIAIQRRSLFIQTATTPNPESLKFIPNGRLVLGHLGEGSSDLEEGEETGIERSSAGETNGVHITRKDQTLISRSPLAKQLFNLDPGVKSTYLGRDFVTVTKYAEAHWQHLQTPIFGAIMDFYGSGQPALRDQPEITDTTILDDDDEVVAMIKELLETRIRPAVQEDGGDIKYVGFEEETGIVTVQLAGSCVGCPSSSVTLKNGVENMLMHYIPEVTNVVSLEEEDDEDEYEGSTTGDVVIEQTGSGEESKKMKSYQDKLAAAGIPFSD